MSEWASCFLVFSLFARVKRLCAGRDFPFVAAELGNDETTRLGFLLLYEPWLTICVPPPPVGQAAPRGSR